MMELGLDPPSVDIHWISFITLPNNRIQITSMRSKDIFFNPCFINHTYILNGYAHALGRRVTREKSIKV